jgi:hypothetical protein
MKLLRQAPPVIRAAVAAIVLLPIVTCMVWFRLYAHPKNPDAWFILAVLLIVSAIAALLILKRVGAIRWLWCVWFGGGMIFGVTKAIDMWNAGYPYLVVRVSAAWAVQIAVAVLLFLPSSNAFFRNRPKA